MSENRNRRGRQKSNPSGGKGNKGNKGGKGRNKPRKKQQSRKPAIDPNRPLWANDAGEAEVRAAIGHVHAAQDPTALVRSLGPPPLGKFGDNAPHYYAAVYEKAQRFAIAMATANGVLLVDDDDEEPTEPDA